MCAWERCQVRLTSLDFLSEAGYAVIVRARVNLISLVAFKKINTRAHKDWPVRPNPAFQGYECIHRPKYSLLNEETDSLRHHWGLDREQIGGGQAPQGQG